MDRHPPRPYQVEALCRSLDGSAAVAVHAGVGAGKSRLFMTCPYLTREWLSMGYDMCGGDGKKLA